MAALTPRETEIILDALAHYEQHLKKNWLTVAQEELEIVQSAYNKIVQETSHS